MNKAVIDELKNKIDDVRIDEPMGRHTSFKLGGPADVMVLPKTQEEIISVLNIVDSKDLFLMGRGTNLLVTSKGIRGVVMKIADNFSGVDIIGTHAVVKSGTQLSALVRQTCGEALGGIEFLGGIPGTIGGAVAMNAGAYGGEIGDFVEEVTLATRSGIIVLRADEMNFSYRHSIISDLPVVVVSAKMFLTCCDPDESKCKQRELNARRREKQPLEYPSAGSTFKRPSGHYAGALIQEAGLKGFSVGGAQVSEKHAGFVINTGDATPDDVISLIKEVQRIVKEKSGVSLETEVKVVGEL